MPRLERTSTGDIFFDDFNGTSLDERWVLTPSLDSRYSLSEKPGYLRIKHSDSSTYILTDIPATNEMLFEIKNDYKPVVSNDIGGIVVYKTSSDRVELVEYYDPILDASRNYLYVRMYKSGDIFDGYGSQDGVLWELIGSARIEDAVKIGLVLNGVPNILTVPFDIDYTAMYSDRYLYVENLQENMSVKLFDKNNNFIEQITVGIGTSVAKFDMFSRLLPFEGYLELYSESGALLSKTVSQRMYPGDEFQYTMNIDVRFQRRVFVMEYDSYGNPVSVPKFINDVDLILDDITHIGDMEGAYVEGKLVIKNLDAEDITNLEASIQMYTDSYATSIIKLAVDNYGEPDVYQDKVIINVPAGSTTNIWIKISSTSIPTLSKYDVFKYKLILRNV
jgi:hypothetical protein